MRMLNALMMRPVFGYIRNNKTAVWVLCETSIAAPHRVGQLVAMRGLLQ